MPAGYLVQTIKAGAKRLLSQVQHDALTSHLFVSPTYIDEIAATAVPSTYPVGYSIMHIATDATWPMGTTDGLVETWVTGTGAAGYRGKQVYTEVGGVGTIQFHRFMATSDTWSDWRLVTAYQDAPLQTATQYDIVDADTWETALEREITVFPTVRFSARVTARTHCWYNAASTSSVRQRVGISLDGGTPTYGLQTIDERPGSEITTLSNAFSVYGTVTDTIIAQLQVYSTDAAEKADDMHIDVLVT